MSAAQTTAGWRRWLVPAGLVALLVIGAGWLWHAGVLHRISNKDRLIAMLRESGSGGALLCIGIQFLQVVIAVIPGEITSFAAGYVFGGWRGFVYSAIGVTLGSAFNFCFARVVGRPTLERLVGRDTLARLDRSLDTARSRSAMFLLFLLPGVPKDVLCYAAGFSGMPLIEFVVLSGLARSPALLASVLIGAGVSRGDYRSLIATAVVLLLAIGGYYWYRRSRKEGTRHAD
ncbi:MAG: hypothetical protein AUH78_17975 [Gemmatimonadetes bacterium 13_1_40CM_4_69_8]|nr:MAG: hypothetical protein AUH78_17975 [Gemmatimonadetes bacterium 13_1_40CM_4_69_8]